MINYKTMENIYTAPMNCVGAEKRKICYSSEINREIDKKHLKTLRENLRGGWRKELHINVFPAELINSNLGSAPKIVMKDLVTGIDISDSELHNYYFTADGQHRLFTQLLLNQESEESITEVPSMFISLRDGETIPQYIASVNVNKSWGTTEYTKTSANIYSDSKPLAFYAKYISDKKVAGKYPLSTLNLILYGNKDKINKDKITKIMKGIIDVPSGYNVEKAERFIKLTEEKFKGYYLGNRYLIEKFLEIQNETGNSESAFKVFECITDKDVASMLKSSSSGFKLDENQINLTIQEIRDRDIK